MQPMPDFDTWFQIATGNRTTGPFSFQRWFAQTKELPQLVNVPTGCGKTAMAILGWLWRRHFHEEETVRKVTPRRLVYCLPMRVLVEQTVENARTWLKNLKPLVEKDSKLKVLERIGVYTLMGGDVDDDWALYPERDTILVGTQDMLLSRALNRGYAMSRYRWPVHFGLLNNDALWVVDEVQLFGVGLATTTQLQAFRRQVGTFGSAQTLWMSATMEPSWLETIDVDPSIDLSRRIEVDPTDPRDERLQLRVDASKPLKYADARMGENTKLADEIAPAHKPGTRTLVIVNTVKRAVAIYDALRKKRLKAKLVLVHSRFRPPDRQRKVEELLAPPSEAGTIVVSTQVVEAGVDVSAKTLFTELGPWPSLVQRFGRCNRLGDEPDAAVYWIDLPAGEKEQGKSSPPMILSPSLKPARRFSAAVMSDRPGSPPFRSPLRIGRSSVGRTSSNSLTRPLI